MSWKQNKNKNNAESLDYYKGNVQDYNIDEFGINPDDLLNTELKINPSFYFHLCFLKAQDCLVKDDVNDGFLQFMVNAQYLENLGYASGNIPGNYEQLVEAKEKELRKDYSDDESKILLNLSMYKFRIIQKEVFNAKTITKALNTKYKGVAGHLPETAIKPDK